MSPDAVAVPELDLGQLYAEQRVRLLRLAHLLTGSPAIAEEVVQDAFVVLHTTDRSLAQPAAYARAVVVNLARKAQRRRGVEERHAARAAEPAPVLPPELDETWAVVRRLAPDQRAVVVLRFYEDASLAEIAELLDRPVGTVKSLLHRALRHLSKELS